MKFDSWVPNFNFPCIPEEIRKYELAREVDLFNLDTLERKQNELFFNLLNSSIPC